ncbi:putative membrane protein [Rhodopirellula maiorica SM1]|uniref:Putative membrane protein n=1 Tax=Rhodopirellula maiorica SM1 TaxID=1265738 RepID=M5RPB8_9BACT|nr:hypothetical protein [Rhodopirellula maiorica]EMI17232.1 putative membrane protein [Rhodopirellula maiorica SM1]
MSGASHPTKFGALWDAPHVHQELLWLTNARSQFRLRRTLARILSPRRIVATLLAGVFLVAYVMYGVLVLSNRAPASPDHLRAWLSGGMVLYAFYHAVRCVWTETVVDLEMTPAERLWLGGGPLHRSSLATYRITNIVSATAIKTLLLTIVIARDVQHVELLILGVFCSLLLLDTVRQILVRVASGLSDLNRRRAKVVSVVMATAVALQVIAKVTAMTPMGSPTWLYLIHMFYAVGELAQSVVIQAVAFAWIPMASLAVTTSYSVWTPIAMVCVAMTVLFAVRVLVWADHGALMQSQRQEQSLLRELDRSGRNCAATDPTQTHRSLDVDVLWGYPRLRTTAALLARQYRSVLRYRGTILASFVIPTLLCLSPLVTNQVIEQWFYVVSGVALCTMLLAPPALRLDFRRDLLRMQLLKSLPVKPLSMVLGQLTLPIFITWIFQCVTLAIAACVVQPGWSQWLMWTLLMAAFAVFTFAVENALFLVYPHHAHQQGLGMMLRAKLTFLGKAGVIAASLAMLVLWSAVCKSILPDGLHAIGFVSGAIAASWCIAAMSVLATAICWRRFDLSFDLPPQ